MTPQPTKWTVDTVDHHYASTACQHREHQLCRQECKYCGNPCLCPCHEEQLRDAMEEAGQGHSLSEYVSENRGERIVGDPEGLRIVGDVKMLRAEPGDIGVIEVPQAIEQDEVYRIKAVWEELVPGVPLLVLADGARLIGVRPAPEEPSE